MTDKICDCNQGRLPCSCKPNPNAKRPEILMVPSYGGDDVQVNAYADLYRLNLNAEEFEQRVNAMPEPFDYSGYWRDQTVEARTHLDEVLDRADALDMRVKIYQGVAIIGWVAAILLALGV